LRAEFASARLFEGRNENAYVIRAMCPLKKVLHETFDGCLPASRVFSGHSGKRLHEFRRLRGIKSMTAAPLWMQ
jgi:hypothetical protein